MIYPANRFDGNIAPIRDHIFHTGKAAVMANIAYFEIPADNVERAKHFYTSLFGWRIVLGETTPEQAAIAAMQYHAVLTGEAKEGRFATGGKFDWSL